MDELFDHWWWVAVESGFVDAHGWPGRAELKQEWVQAGCPLTVVSFLRDAANVLIAESLGVRPPDPAA